MSACRALLMGIRRSDVSTERNLHRGIPETGTRHSLLHVDHDGQTVEAKVRVCALVSSELGWIPASN